MSIPAVPDTYGPCYRQTSYQTQMNLERPRLLGIFCRLTGNSVLHTRGLLMRQGGIRAARGFLDRAFFGPAGMVVEGEGGMGKTTFLWNVAETAAAEGFRIMSTAGALSEARYAYAAVADLLDGVDTALFADLPAVQR